MEDSLQKIREVIAERASSINFVHHTWFVEWHLKVVEHISRQLLVHYPAADENIVIAMAWMHDYGKIINYATQHDTALIDEGRRLLIERGLDAPFAEQVAENIKILDSKTNIEQANIETQIVSSADGCSHLVGPFISLFWQENPDLSLEQLMQENVRKLTVDWDKKVTLQEARTAYQTMHDIELAKAQGALPAL